MHTCACAYICVCVVVKLFVYRYVIYGNVYILHFHNTKCKLLIFARVACAICLRNILREWLCECPARVVCASCLCEIVRGNYLYKFVVGFVRSRKHTHTHTLAQQRIYVHACARTHAHTWTFAQNGRHTADLRARVLCEPCVSPAQADPASCLRELLVRAASERFCARCLRKTLARATSFARAACARVCAR